MGTERRVLAMQSGAGHFFVAPDNGLLSVVAERDGVVAVHEGVNRALWRDRTTSTTFHGRDIFGPIAANVANGVPVEKVGPSVTDMVELDLPRSEVKDDTVSGVVVRVDPYGNMITNISRDNLTEAGIELGDALSITIGKASFKAPLKLQYGDVAEGERLAMIQSAGLLECAVNMKSLAAEIKEEAKAAVLVKKAN